MESQVTNCHTAMLKITQETVGTSWQFVRTRALIVMERGRQFALATVLTLAIEQKKFKRCHVVSLVSINLQQNPGRALEGKQNKTPKLLDPQSFQYGANFWRSDFLTPLVDGILAV